MNQEQQLELQQAINAATYRDVVSISLSSKEDNVNNNTEEELVLVASLDRSNGGLTWNRLHQDLENTESLYPSDSALVRYLETKQWVMPMLHDTTRNELYEKAIEQACSEVWKRVNGNKLHALDIGTGTGLLAMLVAKYGQKSAPNDNALVHVTAWEMSSSMTRLANRVLADNGFLQDSPKQPKSSIILKEGHTCSPNVVLDPKAMLCTCELLESGLLGEGWLPTMRDAWTRHLNVDAIVIPCRARIIAQVVDGGSVVANYRGPHDENSCMSFQTSSSNSGNKHSWVDGSCTVPMHLDALFEIRDQADPSGKAVRKLCHPITVMEFDVTSLDKIPSSEGRCLCQNVLCTQTGIANGVVFWWELDLFENFTYSTEPSKQDPWQDHWQQVLYVLLEEAPLQQGQEFTMYSFHNDTQLGFCINRHLHKDTYTASTSTSSPSKRLKAHDRSCADVTQQCLSSLCQKNYCSPERALQLNDGPNRIEKLSRSISLSLTRLKAKSTENRPVVVLDVSDFSLCAILIAKYKDIKCFVNSIESRSALLAAKVAQFGNRLDDALYFQILNAHPDQLSTVDMLLGQQSANFVVAEPYYEQLEGCHILEALNFYYILKGLRHLGIASSDCLTMPIYASIQACAIQFERPISTVYQSIKNDSICDFNHAAVNHYFDQIEQRDIYLPLWQYKYQKLTKDVELTKLLFDREQIDSYGPCEVSFESIGSCHGLIVWVDYGLQGDLLSTLTRQHRQLVRLFPQPFEVTTENLHETKLSIEFHIAGCLEYRDFDLSVSQLKS